MRFIFSLLLVCLTWLTSMAQIDNFPEFEAKDLTQTYYSLDSSAAAIVLMEKGRTFIEVSESDRAYMVFHNYKVRIKILKQDGYEQANFSIPLYKFGSTFEYIRAIKGITYNYNNGSIQKTELEQKNIYHENKSEYLKITKFTLPDIKVGSIIDVEYTVISPDIFNFRTWNFQSDIPKIKSEYNVLIPSVYQYNVTLKGFLKLSETKSKVEKECLSIHNTRVDCSNLTYIMDNISAFQEEDHMLAPKNYLSAIYFELEEVYRAGGSKQSFTKQWKDVDRDLLNEKSFGGQLKKQDYLKSIMEPEILKIADHKLRAIQVYQWVQNNIKWNNYYGKYSQNGIEDAFKQKNGNIADINLALIAALNVAGIEAYPILVSSRDNGLPHHLHPVISDFNYVIAGAKIDDEIIQLDASDKLLSFSQLPLRAINGEGRIIYSKKSSEWIPLINKIISTKSYVFNGKVDLDGRIKGSLDMIYFGLEAYNRRRDILNYNSIEEYKEKLDERLTSITIDSLEVFNLDIADNTLNVDADIIVETEQDLKSGTFAINPIFIDRITKNPFNLDERHFPVDLGAMHSENVEIKIEMPEGVTLLHKPKNVNLTLPENSARYIYKSDYEDNILTVTQQLSLKKSMYSPEEYFGLKEMYSRIIQQLKIDFIFNYQSK